MLSPETQRGLGGRTTDRGWRPHPILIPYSTLNSRRQLKVYLGPRQSSISLYLFSHAYTPTVLQMSILGPLLELLNVFAQVFRQHAIDKYIVHTWYIL